MASVKVWHYVWWHFRVDWKTIKSDRLVRLTIDKVHIIYGLTIINSRLVSRRNETVIP